MEKPPYEVKAWYRVPRNEVDSWLKFFRNGVNDGNLLPPEYKSTAADLHPDPADGPEAAIWVLFQRVEQTDEKGNPI